MTVILKFYEEYVPKNTSKNHMDNLNKIIVERLLTMSIKDFLFSGLTRDNWL